MSPTATAKKSRKVGSPDMDSITITPKDRLSRGRSYAGSKAIATPKAALAGTTMRLPMR
jgi:hypothetical protein